MNRADAEARMKELLGDAANLLTESDIDWALSRSLTWDSEGRAPGDDGYVDTYDPAWAAAEAATQLAIRAIGQGGILEFSSEGSSFKRSAPDFWEMSRWLRRMSPMSPDDGHSLGVETVDGSLSHYTPTTAQFRGIRGVQGNWN